ncbi:hypothetical protein EVAR_41520_1 [Eumeta japonica]|uniref:Uncharacterized protein n=1 Tax=Eumeta variegata TaxID=151549 RepID=A0A4C1X3Z5_EUMVA|nr:hypothetical protein EVAR_41520_1 [Eumeta japonica]
MGAGAPLLMSRLCSSDLRDYLKTRRSPMVSLEFKRWPQHSWASLPSVYLVFTPLVLNAGSCDPLAPRCHRCGDK